MTTKHTPGPWHVEAPKPARFPAHRVLSATDGYICDVTIMANNPAQANARLIAAAPELLAALKEITTVLPECRAGAGGTKCGLCRPCNARNIMEKITGE